MLVPPLWSECVPARATAVAQWVRGIRAAPFGGGSLSASFVKMCTSAPTVRGPAEQSLTGHPHPALPIGLARPKGDGLRPGSVPAPRMLLHERRRHASTFICWPADE